MNRHSRAGGNLVLNKYNYSVWIPACAGMTALVTLGWNDGMQRGGENIWLKKKTLLERGVLFGAVKLM